MLLVKWYLSHGGIWYFAQGVWWFQFSLFHWQSECCSPMCGSWTVSSLQLCPATWNLNSALKMLVTGECMIPMLNFSLQGWGSQLDNWWMLSWYLHYSSCSWSVILAPGVDFVVPCHDKNTHVLCFYLKHVLCTGPRRDGNPHKLFHWRKANCQSTKLCHSLHRGVILKCANFAVYYLLGATS